MPRHTGETRKVHREEQDIRTNERNPEMQSSDPVRGHIARHFWEPVIPCRKDREDRSKRQHVMEVSDDIIGIVKVTVEPRIRQHDASYAADCEQEDEPDGPHHRCREADGAAPHCRDPGKDFHTCRNRNNHRREDEVTLRVKRQSSSIHVMRPDDETNRPNRNHRIRHTEITENRLLRERRDDVADNAEARQNHDVHLWMTEEPEQMLIQNRITATRGIKECRSEIAIRQQHGDRTSENRKRQEQQERGHKHGPCEQRHSVHGQARRAHIQDGGDEIDRTKNGGCTREMERQNTKIKRRTRMPGN